jgi:hypothetical protein
MSRQGESIFSDKVKKFLDKLPNTWHVRVPAFLAGLPDRWACINGRFVALEVKLSAKADKRPLQRHIINQMQKCGAYAEFVYPENWEEVKKELERIAGAENNY